MPPQVILLHVITFLLGASCNCKALALRNSFVDTWRDDSYVTTQAVTIHNIPEGLAVGTQGCIPLVYTRTRVL
jgi:hypothetical protein